MTHHPSAGWICPGAQRHHHAAEAAARKILDEPQKTGESNRPGFELPRFKTPDEYRAEFRETTPSDSERIIRASAVSPEKLRLKLLPDERELLEAGESAAPPEA